MSRSARDDREATPEGPADDGQRTLPPTKLDAPVKPRRFYKDVAIVEAEQTFSVTLDGRAIRTPAKHRLIVPRRTIAAQIAAEWSSQGEIIEPLSMPATRLANSVVDGVVHAAPEVRASVRAEIVRYVGSDLVCYRAQHPRALAARQSAAWDPVLAWLKSTYGVRLALTSGVMPVDQSKDALARFDTAIGSPDPFALSALHAMTTLMGSAVLALAVAAGQIDGEAAWLAAHVDEDWQIAQWGADEEAAWRRSIRHGEMRAAMTLLGDAPLAKP